MTEKEVGHARQALINLWRYYENGLDTAGESGAALMFEQWRNSLETGELSTVESLENAIQALQPNNPDVVTELLQMFVDGWDRNQEHLEDAINQACTYEHKAGRNIIGGFALSAYEAAIDWLVDQGRLVRLPGRIERYVWQQDATLLPFPLDTTVDQDAICQECYELKKGIHYKKCPTRLIGWTVERVKDYVYDADEHDPRSLKYVSKPPDWLSDEDKARFKDSEL